MNTEPWSFDRQTGIVKHINGLTVEIQNGEVIEIQFVPTDVSTRELPRLLKEAVRASRSSAAPSQAATRNKPKRPILKLKK